MDVEREVRAHLGVLTLNRPAALNALTLAMIRELRDALESFAADRSVRAVLLRGAGDKAFCAGGDLRALYDSIAGGGELHRDFFVAEYTLDYLLHAYPKPYVVSMDGITMGGGMGLAQGSRLRVVGDRTRIAMPEVAIGLFPDVGGSHFLSRLPGALGPYLALTGTQIRGADALYATLADVYLPPDAGAGLADLLAAVEWTDDWHADVRGAVRARAAQGLPAPSLSVLREAIDEHFGAATVRAILESLERESRPARIPWARQSAALLRSRSPMMLEVTRRQLELGRDKPLADCFRMELGMVRHCVEHGDFREGIRALIIDKDNAPRWSPARLEDVTDAMVANFFRDPYLGAPHPLARLESVAP